jgi:hypothetical protein
MPFKEVPTFLATEKSRVQRAPSPSSKPEPLKKLARWNSVPSRVDCGQQRKPNQFVLSLTK